MNLLVSVRSVDEAAAALEGGADLIDIKEPERGTLGRADDSMIAAIIDVVAGRRPVSAAMGELRDASVGNTPPTKLDFIKFGLAGCRDHPWRERLLELRALLGEAVVPTAYADWERSGSPRIDAVVEFAAEHHFAVVLIDTFEKDGHNLFSWLNRSGLRQTVDFLREHRCRAALGGSLSERDLDSIVEVRPEWLAVRGAACEGRNRLSRVNAACVRRLKEMLVAHDHRTQAAASFPT